MRGRRSQPSGGTATVTPSPTDGSRGVAVFRVHSAEALQGHLTEWGKRVPTFDVTLLVVPDHQKQMVGHLAD